jgi:hypothetical protein
LPRRAVEPHPCRLGAGARRHALEDRPRYNKSRCFETFPFPVATPAQQARIRDLAEQIDAHRKRVLAAHDELTLTGLYNVLVKVGAGDTALSAKEKPSTKKASSPCSSRCTTNSMPPCSMPTVGTTILPTNKSSNASSPSMPSVRRGSAAPSAGCAPNFRRPHSAQAAIGLESGDSGRRNQKSDEATSPPAPAHAPTAAINGPPRCPEQLATLAAALGSTPQTESQLAANFTGKGRWKSRLPDILEALEALGRARRLDDGRWLG